MNPGNCLVILLPLCCRSLPAWLFQLSGSHFSVGGKFYSCSIDSNPHVNWLFSFYIIFGLFQEEKQAECFTQHSAGFALLK